MKNAFATLVVLLSCALPPAGAQNAATDPASSVSSPLKIGRYVLALAPGEWQLIPLDSTSATMAGEGATRPVSRMLAVQVDAPARRLKAAAFFMAPQVTSPNVESWSVDVCKQQPALHRDMLDGNFNFPACLVTNEWILPAKPTGPFASRLVEWLKAHDIEVPGSLLWVRYVKYRGGDFLWAAHYVNPQAFGGPAPVDGVPVGGRWSQASLQRDPLRSAYLEQFKKWGYVMAGSARATLLGGSPAGESLPAFPVWGQ